MTKSDDVLGVTQAHEVPVSTVLNLSPSAAAWIGKWLTAEMDEAVKNGANSVSMPDELVEIAAWLCGIAPRVPHLNRDATVAVSPTYTYNEDMSQAPRGVKLILLGQGGVAQLSEYQGDPFWIGWAALPRRAEHG